MAEEVIEAEEEMQTGPHGINAEHIFAARLPDMNLNANLDFNDRHNAMPQAQLDDDLDVPKEENVVVAALSEVYCNPNTWRILKSLMIIVMMLKLAYEIDCLPEWLVEFVPFKNFDLTRIKELFHTDEY